MRKTIRKETLGLREREREREMLVWKLERSVRGLVVAFFFFLVVGLASPQVSAETVAKLHGVKSYVETKGSTALASGVFSATLWVRPERNGTEEEAVLSFASSTLKTSATIGWKEGKFFYRDDTKGNVSTPLTYNRKQWHHVALATTKSDKAVYRDANSQSVAHRSVVLYVDGAKALEFSTVLPDLTNAVVTLGAEYTQYHRGKYFTGLVDELRIYPTTLTETEASNLPFTKPPTGTETYLNFDALSTLDLSAETREVGDVVYSYVETVTVDYMPYDPLTISTVSKSSPFSNSLYTEYEGPMSGLVLTVNGANFAKTTFLEVTMDGATLAYDYVSSSKLLVTLPQLELSAAGKKKIKVTNGGTNSGEFDFTYAYSIVEDLNSGLVAHYNLDGSTQNVDRSLSQNDAKNPKTYQGEATFTTDRNDRINRALKFSYGQRLDVPLAVGASSKSTLCLWFYAEPGAHTLYSEKGHSHNVAKYNELSIGSDGVIYFRGSSSGSSITFDSWQFVCVAQDDSAAVVYRAGQQVATISTSPVEETLTTAMIASHLKGNVDDVWLWERQLSSDEIKSMYENDQYAIQLDGSLHFTLTNGESQFTSSSWHSNSEITVEAWIKPEVVTGTSRIIYQPSKTNGATGDAALGFSVSLVDGRIEFRIMLDSTLNPPIFRSIATSSAVITTGKWYLVSATYDQSSMVIAVNGVAQSVGVSSFLTGSLSVTEPFVKKYTFLTIVSDPTSLDKQPLETSTKSIIVGESFKGFVGEVRLWSDDLTEVQLQTYHDCKPSTKSQPSLYAVFRFDEGVGSEYSSGSSPSIVLKFSGSKKPFWVSSDHGKPAATISWPQSPVTGSGRVSAKAGETGSFTFQAKDVCGNLLKKGGDSVQVILGGPLDRHLYLFNGSSVDNGDGTYSGSYQANHCGFYALRVEDVSVPVKDGSYLNGTFASKLAKDTPIKIFIDSTVTNAGLTYAYDDTDLRSTDDRTSAIAGATAKFTLQSIDEYGCVKATGGDIFNVLLSGKYTQDGRVVDLGNGKYTVEYSPLITGKSLLSVTLGGKHVGTTNHSSVQGENLSLYGYDGKHSPFCVDASSGSSLEFDGSNFVEVADAPALDLSDTYTIDFFVKPKQTMLTAKLLSKESPVSGRGYYISLSNGLLSTGVYVGAEQYRFIETSYAPTVNEWTHLAVVYDGMSLVIYADGKEVAKQIYEDSRTPRENSQKLIIGNGLVGLLDEVRVSGQAFTQTELTSMIYCPSLSESVLAYYRLNDKVGSIASDYSDSNIDGVLKGSPLPTFSTDEAPTHTGVIDLSSSIFEGAGLKSATVGEDAHFTAKLFDKCGFPYNTVLVNNSIPSSLMNVAFENVPQRDRVKPENNAKTLPVASLSADSHYCVGTNIFEAKYNATSCGLSDLKITVEGQDLTPYTVSILSNNITDASKTSASITSKAISGLPFEIKITAADTFGCRRIGGGDNFDLALTRISKPSTEGTMHGPDTIVKKFVSVDNGDGTYTAKVLAPSPGRYLLDIAGPCGAGECRIPGSPFNISVEAAPFRKILAEGPGERYKSMLTSYKGDVYVINGWAKNKESLNDVWRYEPDLAESTWNYRRKYTFTSAPGHAIAFTVNTKALIDHGKLNADCSDILFKSASTSSSIPYWIEPLPGCNSAKATFWLTPSEKDIYMYYGNTYAKPSVLSSPESLMVSYDDFEGGATFGDHGYTLSNPTPWQLTGSDPAAFEISTEVSVTGSSSLKVNSLSTLGGAIEKSVTSMNKYVLKGYFYDALQSSSVNWFSPNYSPPLNDSNPLSSQDFALGVNSQTSSVTYSTSYPWKMSSYTRTEGWHSFEVKDDGTAAKFSIDGIEMDSKPSKALNKIYFNSAASVGAWDSIFVAQYTPAIDVAASLEEEVIWNGKSFFKVKPRGTAPPARRTTSFVLDDEKLYLIGGFGNYGSIDSGAIAHGAIGSHAAEDKVWYLNINKMRWEHVIPYGSLRPVPREDHSMAVHKKKIYLFGGKSGSTFLDDLLAYDIEENAYYSIKSTGPSGRFGHSAITYKDSMYVYGGYTEAGPSTEMWMFDYNTGKWLDVTPAGSPPPRFMFASALKGESWYVYGGHTADSLSSELYRYDFEYNIWVKKAYEGSPKEVANAASFFIGDEMYLFGGKTSSTYSSDFLQLSL